MEQASLIQGINLNKTVISGDSQLIIFHDINLTIKSAETIAITGTSGSGKTTLLGLLAGLDTPTSGEVILKEHKLSILNEDQRAKLRAQLIGFVFQSFHLLNGLTALENVMLPLEISNQTDIEQRAHILLDKIGLSERKHHYPQQLSGGEQQRVAIARAFVTEPKILFADEPTGNLDNKTSDKIIDLLFRLNNEDKTTLVIVTHDSNIAAKCQRQLKIENGQLYEIT